MFKEWLKSDIEKASQKSDRVVISDPTRFLTFAIKDFSDYALLTLNSNAEEMNARLQAQTAHDGSKVLFLCFFPSEEISQLMEFTGVGGFINLDNPDSYIRNKLYQELRQNITLPESKLLLSAMLSDGKALTWWRGIVNETIEPLDLKEHLHLLIQDPNKYQISHDDRIFTVFRDDVFKIIGQPSVPVDAKTLLRELSDAIFMGLIENKLPPSLIEIYYWWANTNDLIPILHNLAASWHIPDNASPINANPDHPFEALDRRLLIAVGERLRNNATVVDLTEAVRKRISSKNAISQKPKWLKDLLVLLDYDSSDLYLYGSIKKITNYYMRHFSALDTALRHLYDKWLAEPELLRPLQEIYESHMKAFLSAWFSVTPANYSPSQLGLIEKALKTSSKVAVLVCDGLRLEIAETVAKKLCVDTIINRKVEYAKLPTVTENGMSALFGLDCVVTTTAPRLNKLRACIPDVEIMHYVNLASSMSANKLVVMFGDIDTAGEHKGLAGLHDINHYESEIANAVRRLHRMGYDDVFITADHGFVITGLLDEASKVPAPAGVDVKERFFLTDELFEDKNYIRREDTFPGSQYQYYSKTDKPFRTRGAYGYAHGGFSPQECLIPFYCISSKDKHSDIKVVITNRDILSAVIGQFFSVTVKGNEASVGKRVKVILYKNGVEESSALIKIADDGKASCEFELSGDNMSVIVKDAQNGIQLDNASVKKAFSRDLDDLFS